MLPQDFENACEISYILVHQLALYNHVINIDLNVPTQLWFEHFGHHPLISRPFIFQAKGHHLVVIISYRSNKICLLLII